MTDLHLDGNGVAGMLTEIFGADVTTARRTCMSCGERHELAAHRAYRGAGVVLRCPSCGAVAVRIGIAPDRLIVEWRGPLEIARVPADEGLASP
jgi:predicted RNA-binding Zn-ribbon protein involved in translation (DUF1610 family)